MGVVVWVVDAAVRELLLFAAVGFLIGGIDDLAIDILWFWKRARERFRAEPTLDALPKAARPLRFAILIATWDEAAVIGAMLTSSLARIRHADYRLYVGVYPNDPATITAVREVAAQDDRVRLVVGELPGPTTKADNLNTIWRAMMMDDTRDGRATDAIVLHDAEDVIHADELDVHQSLLTRHIVVQIPVAPLIDETSWASRAVSGHYADEFGEAHARQLVVRSALGGGLPLAGVGCAIAVPALAEIAGTIGPFDASSLTEDYELGLRFGDAGHSMCFARVRDAAGAVISTRAYFPSTVEAAVRQKARWMTGIALAGWDRLGWARVRDVGQHWMRMRDRRPPLAVAVLATAYLAIVAWGMSLLLHAVTGAPIPPLGSTMQLILLVNAAMMAWRVLIRVVITTRLYGWREGWSAVPRVFVANFISLLAVRRAFARYAGTLRGRPLAWEKTEHAFPVNLRA